MIIMESGLSIHIDIDTIIGTGLDRYIIVVNLYVTIISPDIIPLCSGVHTEVDKDRV